MYICALAVRPKIRGLQEVFFIKKNSKLTKIKKTCRGRRPNQGLSDETTLWPI
jgi:hypothetical protein